MRSSYSMKALFFAALLFLTPFSLSRPHAEPPDVFWLDKYGNIAWEDEKARLDNFAIQLMHDANEIGYFYVRSGRVSCRGEAQARAVRAKNYMIRVRNADGNRMTPCLPRRGLAGYESQRYLRTIRTKVAGPPYTRGMVFTCGQGQ